MIQMIFDTSCDQTTENVTFVCKSLLLVIQFIHMSVKYNNTVVKNSYEIHISADNKVTCQLLK